MLTVWADADDGMMGMIEALRKAIKWMHYPLELMLICVRWYAAYPLSLRHIAYRAVDRDGDTIDFLLRAHRDATAARRFFVRAMDLHDVPQKITIDKSGANTAAIEAMRSECGAEIEMRQSKYLNNIVEQDHRTIERIVRLMMGFKALGCARIILADIETMHMIKKGQLNGPKIKALSAASQFDSLAF